MIPRKHPILAVTLALTLAGCAGVCTPEKAGPEGGTIVPDVEHNPITGQPLTGLPKFLSQFSEALFCPAK